MHLKLKPVQINFKQAFFFPFQKSSFWYWRESFEKSLKMS